MDKTLQDIIIEKFKTGYDPVPVAFKSRGNIDGDVLHVDIEGRPYVIDGNNICTLEDYEVAIALAKAANAMPTAAEGNTVAPHAILNGEGTSEPVVGDAGANLVKTEGEVKDALSEDEMKKVVGMSEDTAMSIFGKPYSEVTDEELVAAGFPPKPTQEGTEATGKTEA